MPCISDSLRVTFRVAAMLAFSVGPLWGAGASASDATLRWSDDGIILETDVMTVCLDSNGSIRGPILRFPPDKGEQRLSHAQVTQASPTRVTLEYQAAGPDGIVIAVKRDVVLAHSRGETELVETFEIAPAQPLQVDLEIERPFSLKMRETKSSRGPVQAVLPLKNGWAKPCLLSPDILRSEYRLGHPLTGEETLELALPTMLVDCGGDLAIALSADANFSVLYQCVNDQNAISGSLCYRYAGTRVPIKGTERRSFGVWISGADEKGGAFERAVDAFFRMMLPDVCPGPAWLHMVAMVDYDYLSDGGNGWERDVNELARILTPEERSRVALCFHGWYDAIGAYCYDEMGHRMKEEWTAMARTRKVQLTQEEVKRRLRLARSQGFRVLMYFADGLLQDSGVPQYRPDWDFRDSAGNRITGWQGPDTFGMTYARNPAHPQVIEWYKDYLDAMLRTYGPDVDGFVWDETFYIRTGAATQSPEPAYADRAMMALVKSLTAQVEAFDGQKVFLASDDVGLIANVPGYAMMGDGTFQDSWCQPSAWSYGLFPNWRNTLWSCNWKPITNFHYTRWGVEHFGVPVAISNGWEDDKGPSEWSPAERESILALFRKRLTQERRPMFLTEDPKALLSQSPASSH